MKRSRGLLLVWLSFCALTVAQTRGLKPRADAARYPASRHLQEFALGAEQLSNVQVAHAFTADLDRRYVVVEIGIFPAAGARKIAADDFTLNVVGTKQVIRPSTPQTIAEVLHRKPRPSREVSVYPAGSVGYENGGHDPYGNRYPGGVTTSLGVGVAVDPKQQGATDADRKVIETELRDKALPEGELKQPVAGYLYFPVTTNKPKQQPRYELEYAGDSQKARMALVTPSE